MSERDKQRSIQVAAGNEKIAISHMSQMRSSFTSKRRLYNVHNDNTNSSETQPIPNIDEDQTVFKNGRQRPPIPQAIEKSKAKEFNEAALESASHQTIYHKQQYRQSFNYQSLIESSTDVGGHLKTREQNSCETANPSFSEESSQMFNNYFSQSNTRGTDYAELKLQPSQYSEAIQSYINNDKFNLQTIADGSFNQGGVTLKVDFVNQIIKSVKQVGAKHKDFFNREIKALLKFSKKQQEEEEEVSLRLFEFDPDALVFAQKAGFMSLKQVHNIVKAKSLQTKYRIGFEFFILKQMHFLLRKLDLMNNVHRIAHGDIKPNNIVIGFDFIPYFIDFGGAIFIDIEPQEYLILSTTAFLHPKFLSLKAFDANSIRSCEIASLMLSFLYLLCRNDAETRLFSQRKFDELLMGFYGFYTPGLIQIISSNILELEESTLETRVKDLLDLRIEEHINSIDEISNFLGSLKQWKFHRKEGLYVITEWDEFNENITKLFPDLRFELDISQISCGESLLSFIQDEKYADRIYLDPSKPCFKLLLNQVTSHFSQQNFHTLKITQLTKKLKEDMFLAKDLFKYDNGTFNVFLDFTESNQLHLDDATLRKINCLSLQCRKQTLDLDSSFSSLSFNLIELKIICDDVLDVPTLQEMLKQQTELTMFELKMNNHQYRIELPQLNKLRKLKTNQIISNLENILVASNQSLLAVEVVMSLYDEFSKEVFEKLANLQFCEKVSLKLQSIVRPRERFTECLGGRCASSTSAFFSYLRSLKRVTKLKLNFQDSFLTNEDILGLANCLKDLTSPPQATSMNIQEDRLTHLKLDLRVKNKSLDYESTRQILLALLSSDLYRVKVYINNSPSLSPKDQLANLLSTKDKKLSQQSLPKNQTIKSFSLLLTNFNVNLEQMSNQLSVCHTFKLVSTMEQLTERLFTLTNSIRLASDSEQEKPPTAIIKVKIPSDLKILEMRRHHSYTNLNTVPPEIIEALHKFEYYLSLPKMFEEKQKEMKQADPSTFPVKNDTKVVLQTKECLIKKKQNKKYLKGFLDVAGIKDITVAERIQDYIELKPRKLFYINTNPLQKQMNPQNYEKEESRIRQSIIGLNEIPLPEEASTLTTCRDYMIRTQATAASLVSGVTAAVVQSLSGLLESIRPNNQVKKLTLDFTIQSLSKLVQQSTLGSIFDAVKYNKYIEQLSIKISSSAVSSLEELVVCLQFNETLTELNLDLAHCSLSEKNLEELTEAILANNHVKVMKLNLIGNVDIKYVHSFIYSLKDVRSDLMLTIFFDTILDYELIFSTGLTFHTSSLKKLAVIQSNNNEFSHIYPQFITSEPSTRVETLQSENNFKSSRRKSNQRYSSRQIDTPQSKKSRLPNTWETLHLNGSQTSRDTTSPTTNNFIWKNFPSPLTQTTTNQSRLSMTTGLKDLPFTEMSQSMDRSKAMWRMRKVSNHLTWNGDKNSQGSTEASMSNSSTPKATMMKLVIQRSYHYIRLTLDDNYSVKGIGELLKNNQYIQDLSIQLAPGQKGSNVLNEISLGIEKNSFLRGLDIQVSSGSQLGKKEAISEVVALLQNASNAGVVKLKLTLSSTKIGVASLETLLTEGILPMKNLEDLELDLSSNVLQINAAKRLAEIRTLKKIKHLKVDLSQNFLNTEGVQYIFELISKASPLLLHLELNLDRSYVNNAVMHHLYQAIKKNQSIKFLRVSLKGNQINQALVENFSVSISESHQSIEDIQIILDD